MNRSDTVKLFLNQALKACLTALLMLLLGEVSAPLHAQAQQSHSHTHGTTPTGQASPSKCVEPELRCAKAVMPYFAPDGSLWVVWSAAGAISVARSTDAGKHFGPRIEIARHGELLDTGPDARPQLVGDHHGNMILAYSFFKDQKWNAQVNIATSTDQGKSFSAPRAISSDPASQRFATLGVNAKGQVFAAWVDKREVAASLAAGKKRSGASIVFAFSEDGGQTFTGERVVREQSCECCRIAMAMTEQGSPALLYRAIFAGSVRDHASQILTPAESAGPVRRVSNDNWATESCPHHGPSLAISVEDRAMHAAWFTQGSARNGIFYARSTDQGAHYSAPRQIGQSQRQPGRPYLLAQGRHVWLVWKEFDGKTVTVWLEQSQDEGVSWSKPQQLAQAVGYTDHPLLVSQQNKVYLSWLTAAEGYLFKELTR